MDHGEGQGSAHLEVKDHRRKQEEVEIEGADTDVVEADDEG